MSLGLCASLEGLRLCRCGPQRSLGCVCSPWGPARREYVGIFSNKKPSSSKKASKLSKKWGFGGRTSVEDPVLKTFSKLTKRSNKLWALMSGHYVQVDLVSGAWTRHLLVTND